jgi:predicted ribosomally synthesized peptide with SipW-like signal peptide
MSDNNIELSRRRILAGLGTIGIASAATGAGTMALLSDEETSSGNVVQAGTLDLTQSTTQTFTVKPKPGQSDSMVLEYENPGNVTGTLDLVVTGLNGEGANPESETNTEGRGELGNAMMADLKVDGSSIKKDENDESFNDIANQIYMNVAEISGGTTTVELSYEIPTDVGNEIQGDTITVGISAFLGQKATQMPGQTFNVNSINKDPGSGEVRVASNLVYIDTSTFSQSASQWNQQHEKIGFWFGNEDGKVEVEWSSTLGWSIINNGVGAEKSHFSWTRSDDEFWVAFDDSKFNKFGLIVQPDTVGGAAQAVATPDDAKPWNSDLYDL